MNRMMYRGQGQGVIPGGPLGEARYALASGQADRAERLCRKRLERNPGDVAARVLLAQTLLQQQMIDEAISEAQRAAREQNTNVDAQMVLASALLQRNAKSPMAKVPPEAEDAAKRAVQLQPRAAKTHVQLAEVYLSKQEYGSARAEVDEAIRLEPRLAAAHLMRAIVLLQEKDAEGAIQASDSALRFDRSLTQAEFIKANAYIDLKRYDEANTSLDAAERQNPLIAGPTTQVLRGRIQYKQRKYRQSYQTFLGMQRFNARLRFLSAPFAALQMFFVGQFGQQRGGLAMGFTLLALIVIVVGLILFGLHFIPVVGSWIVTILLAGIAGALAFASVRQLRGRLLPASPNGKLTTIGAGVVAGLAGLALALYIISTVSVSVLHTSKTWSLDPQNGLLGLLIGIAVALGAVVLANRYMNGERSTTVASG